MLIPRTQKHSRRHILEERLRHEAKIMRLARMYGMSEPWRTEWVTKAHHKYSRKAWQNYEEPNINFGLAKLELQERADE